MLAGQPWEQEQAARQGNSIWPRLQHAGECALLTRLWPVLYTLCKSRCPSNSSSVSSTDVARSLLRRLHNHSRAQGPPGQREPTALGTCPNYMILLYIF